MDENSKVLAALMMSFIGCLGTTLGGYTVTFNQSPSQRFLGHMQAWSAGVMIFISAFDLLPESISMIGFNTTMIWFFTGACAFYVIVKAIPEPDPESLLYKWTGDQREGSNTREVLFSGVVNGIGIALHNFPEGMAVFLTSFKDIKLGFALAIGITIHNIPEGMSVAMPIYYATRNKQKAVLAAALSGLFEPLGVLFVAFFFTGDVSEVLIASLLALVAGIMTFLSFYELIPLALKYCHDKDETAKAIFFGWFSLIKQVPKFLTRNLHIYFSLFFRHVKRLY
eukprot:TRINITY_DN2409_c0_g1_i4.p1 TRINITY_DN2409_c0_g1~~TRINITY_DN2409_c0_g1_i4.p1  ORF type:complete len:282 (-),score=49.83 TRINITY_DN2409_c0_g1_i4:102-947(-)